MKAAVWHGREDVRIEEVYGPPAPPPGQIQVKVSWCGICGTDLHEYTGGPLYIPLTGRIRSRGCRRRSSLAMRCRVKLRRWAKE